jgi:peptidoglycan-associated lipoprotein
MSRLLTLSATLACLLAAACSSTPIDTGAKATTASSSTTTPASTPTPATRSGQGVGTPGQTGTAALASNASAPTERSVYFDFDDAAIARRWLDIVERQGQYLSRNAALKVRVEGHTDERGGAEYNLALGQRRAEAVRKALEVYGVKASQIEAVSFGEERPKAAGHDDAAWAQNRRADIAYGAAR